MNMKAEFARRFSIALDETEKDEGRELSDFECEGLEVHVAAEMVDEGLIGDIDEVIR